MNYRAFFYSYFKIGLLAFGGGMLMLPLFEQEIVNRRGWLSRDDIFDYFALSQSLPGLIGANMAAFTGYRLKGPLGAVCAALALVLPAFLVITLIAFFFQSLVSYSIVQSIFRGLNIAIVAILLSAVLQLGRRSLVDRVTAAIFAVVFIIYLITGVNPVLFVVTGALAGLLLAGRRKPAP